MFSKKLIVTCMVVGLSAMAAPASAHGDIQGSEPPPRSVLPRPPRSVAITFTEAPTAQAVLNVTDGCKREIGRGVGVTDATATARVAAGQPGQWVVSYRVISALDGHLTRGSYTFTVDGQKDCAPDPTPDIGNGPPGDKKQAAPNDEDEPEGSSAPVVPIALGAAAIVIVALIVRRSGSG